MSFDRTRPRPCAPWMRKRPARTSVRPSSEAATQSCFATLTQRGKPAVAADVVAGREGLGPLAGDAVDAMFRFKTPADSGGPIAYFASHRGQGGNPSRYGLQIFGSKGVIEILFGYLEPVHYLADAGWSPGRSGANWVRVTSAGIGKPEPLPGGGLHAGNIAAVRDLLASIEENRQPLCSIYEARGTVEMIMAV